MDDCFGRRMLMLGLLSLAGGCASVPRKDAAATIDEALAARGVPAAAWQSAPESGVAADARIAEMLAQPLDVGDAIEIAFARSPRIRETWAELGIAQADVIDAVRPANPTFGYVDLSPREGGGSSKITRSVSLNLADLLMLPSRSRLARADFERVRNSLTSGLVGLAAEVEQAWYEHVGARQVVDMRAAVEKAAAASAEFAERSFAAGNLTPRDLALERAAASEARVELARAQDGALRTRASLAALLGVSSRGGWETTRRLAAPPDAGPPEQELIDQALVGRLDLAAARQEVALLEDALAVTRRWRFVGDVDVGYERESEPDGARLHGPTIALQLPLFDQGQGQVLRAESELEAGRARLAALELAVRNEVSTGLDRLATMHGIAEAYRTALVPQREEVVRREMERYNFMLGGVFELLQARGAEFDAYQAYLEAVRDYWVACTELTRALGGERACQRQGDATIGVDDILRLPQVDMPEMDHAAMDHSSMGHDAREDGETR